MDGPRPMSETDDIAYLRQVQDGLLPKICPTCRDVQIFAQSAMLGGVGGDFYDFPEVANGRRGLIIGDVTGHGLRPSLVMAMVFGALKGTAPYTSNPGDRLKQINRLLVDLNSRLIDRWGIAMCSMFYGILDVPQLRLEYANAGHPPPMACYGEGCNLTQFVATAPPLGVDAEVSFEVCSVNLRGVRRMFFYTDGVMDAFGGGRAGIQRLSEVLTHTRTLSPHAQLNAVFEAARDARSPSPHREDASGFLLDLRSSAIRT